MYIENKATKIVSSVFSCVYPIVFVYHLLVPEVEGTHAAVFLENCASAL